jgi:hypothetical protein
MPRRDPHRRRRRPGRRPPDRYSGRHGPPQPQGFTPAGLRTFYDLCLPALRGREKREFFNRVSAWMIGGFALGGAMLGYALFGPIGAFFGLGGGLMAGGALADKARFYRR